MGLSAAAANGAIDELALAAPSAAAEIELPRRISPSQGAADRLTAVVGIVGERAAALRLPPGRKR
jgi:hypothetical protein